MKRYVAEWKLHWKDDFEQFKNEDGTFDDDKINEFFSAMFKAYNEKYGALSKEVMRGVRKEFALRDVMPKPLHKFANKRNLIIAKSNKKMMGCTLGGFSIFRKRDYHPIGCARYDLSYFEDLHNNYQYFTDTMTEDFCETWLTENVCQNAVRWLLNRLHQQKLIELYNMYFEKAKEDTQAFKAFIEFSDKFFADEKESELLSILNGTDIPEDEE